MDELGLFPHNCGRCGFWTATEAWRSLTGWTLRCTHCGCARDVHGDARQFRAFVGGVSRFTVSAIEKYPQLKQLNTRGAFATLPAKQRW
jgi:hypothetical protein